MEHTFVVTSMKRRANDPGAAVEYVGECQTCGWRGEPWPTETEAEADAEKHPESG